MTGQVCALCMSLACLHGYVMIHIGVCAALQAVIPARGLSVCVCTRITRPRETRAVSTTRTQTCLRCPFSPVTSHLA